MSQESIPNKHNGLSLTSVLNIDEIPVSKSPISKHVCTLDNDGNLSETHNCCTRFKRAFCESLLCSDMNPQTRLYFRSMPEIERERKRQKNCGVWVIHPYSPFRLYVELMMIICFFIHLVNTPWDMLFNVIYNEHLELGLHILLFLILIVGVLDIILTFYTGFLDEKTLEVVLDLATIKKRHLKSWFLIFDIIATTPIEIILNYVRVYNIYYTRWLLFLCVTRLFRLPTFLMYMNNAADLWDLSRNAYKITKYAIISILVVSWIGCTTAIVSMFSYYYHPECTHMNWVIQAKLDHDKTHFDVVITILFRAVSALLTVKHGKFPNVTSEDKLCASLSFLAGFFMFAFLFVLNLQMIMDNSLAEMSNFKFFNQLQHYMSSIRLPPMLKKKIKDFYDYRFRNNSLYDNDTKRMLSESLEYEIKMFRYRSVLLKANITSDLPTEVIQNMLSKVEVEHFMTGDCIIKSGRIGTCMYFIVTGTVAIYTYFGVEMCHLYDGAHFGEMALLLEQRRVTTAIALEPCELCRLNKSDFYECLSRESGVFQKLVLGAKEGMKTVKVLNEMHRAELEKLHILQTKGTLKKYLEGRHQQF